MNANALLSLRLIGDTVDHEAQHLNEEIIENDLGSIPGGRVGLYILGVMATCRNPKNFYEINLLRSLHTKLGKYPQSGFDHPHQYSLAVMALCSSGANIGKRRYLRNIIDRIAKELATVNDTSSDTLAMQVLALSCVKTSMKRKEAKPLRKKAEVAIHLATSELLKRQMNDSTFGENEVTAALASQVSRGGRGGRSLVALIERAELPLRGLGPISVTCDVTFERTSRRALNRSHT